MKNLFAGLAITLMVLSGTAKATSFTVDVGLFDDSPRTTLNTEFDVGQTIFGRLTLGVVADFGDPPPSPFIIEPMELFGVEVFDSFGSPVNPTEYLVGGLFTPTGVGPVVEFDFTMEFDFADEFLVFLFSTPAIIIPGLGGEDAQILDPGPVAFIANVVESEEGVPAPGAIALLGFGLLGLGMRRRKA